jgi:hypothetical protein
MAGVFRHAPSIASGGDFLLVIPIKQIEHTIEVATSIRDRTIDQEQEPRAIHRIRVSAEPNRLQIRIAVRGGAVRKPGWFGARPQSGIHRFQSGLIGTQDQRALTGVERSVKQTREGFRQAGAGQMIKTDFAHRRLSPLSLVMIGDELI